jgi:hypothetical protein
VETPDPQKPTVPANDYRLAGDRRLAQGWKARARDNLAAIRLMTAIQAEGRRARPDEQEQLAKFTAFGATDLADKLFRRAGEGFAPAWEDLGPELEELVSREDLTNLKRATQYAHFTPEFMIRAIWRALRGFGFDGGRVLEPGCGTGLFFALAPEALASKLALTGVEMDAVTARIAKLLYPNAASGTRISPRRACRRSSILRTAIRRSRTASCAPTIRPASYAFPCMTISSRARSSG